MIGSFVVHPRGHSRPVRYHMWGYCEARDGGMIPKGQSLHRPLCDMREESRSSRWGVTTWPRRSRSREYWIGRKPGGPNEGPRETKVGKNVHKAEQVHAILGEQREGVPRMKKRLKSVRAGDIYMTLRKECNLGPRGGMGERGWRQPTLDGWRGNIKGLFSKGRRLSDDDSVSMLYARCAS